MQIRAPKNFLRFGSILKRNKVEDNKGFSTTNQFFVRFHETYFTFF